MVLWAKFMATLIARRWSIVSVILGVHTNAHAVWPEPLNLAGSKYGIITHPGKGARDRPRSQSLRSGLQDQFLMYPTYAVTLRNFARWPWLRGRMFHGYTTLQPQVQSTPTVLGPATYSHTVWPRWTKFDTVTHQWKQFVRGGAQGR